MTIWQNAATEGPSFSALAKGPFRVAAMRRWHVIGYCDMTAPPGITDMTGNAFAAMENLHGRLGNAQVNELADQTEGHRVPATVGLYVIVRCNTGPLPTGQDVW